VSGRLNFYQPVQYVVVNNGARGISRYLAAPWMAKNWVKLHPLHVHIFTSKSAAQKAQRRVRKGQRRPADFQVVEVQLCRV
jgi:hypothetical protein